MCYITIFSTTNSKISSKSEEIGFESIFSLPKLQTYKKMYGAEYYVIIVIINKPRISDDS